MEGTESENRYRAANNREPTYNNRATTRRGEAGTLLRVFTERCEIDYFPDVHFAGVPLG